MTNLSIKYSHLWEISVDKLVLAGHTIFGTGHQGHVITTIDKSIAICADAFESMEEIGNDIRQKPAVLVVIWIGQHWKLCQQ